MPLRIVTAESFLGAWRSGAWQAAGASPGAAVPVATAVAEIIARVRAGGQAALLEYTRRFDRADLTSLEAAPHELAGWASACPPGLRSALEYAARRVREFSARAAATLSPRLEQMDLARISGVHEAWCSLGRVGVYVPGGRAPYPSSVLMTAIPAREAGVGEVVLATPPRPDGSVSPAVAVAAQIAGVDRVFRIGGAQAIAAMATGAGEVPRVDKIAGPGNAYVTEAKRQLYGETGLDGLAGPSEVVALSARAGGEQWVACQLLAQAEHDPDALALAVLLPAVRPDAVLAEVAAGLDRLPAENRLVAGQALAARGALVTAASVDEAVLVANAVAPEHLWIDFPEAQAAAAVARQTARFAGAVFFGPYSPVAVGDYTAGPSHVLPTAGSARWGSPLGPADFMRRVSLVALDRTESAAARSQAIVIATAEGFSAHAASLASACRSGGGDGADEGGQDHGGLE